MQTEIYKDIEGYEGIYRVSDMGSVYSLVSDKVLIPQVDTGGYRKVTLCEDGVKKQYRVHRLVALAFLPNPEAKEQVNHIDGVKTNNSLSNLEWNTRSENLVHSVEVLGNKHGARGEKHHNYGKFLGDHVAAKGVIQYDKEWNEIERYSSTKGASIATGVNRGDITNACKGRYKSAGGFRWKYEPKTEFTF